MTGACLGCGEKTAVHLFVATVEALMQPRVARHLEHLTDLVEQLKKHIQLRLVEEIDVGDASTIAGIVDEVGAAAGDLTLAGLAERIERARGGEPIDQDWLRRVSGLVSRLERLKWRYTEGTSGRGRAAMGMINATGCTSVWGSTFPFNPYPFPWANHLFQDAPSMAMGVFEGHMRKMADGFEAMRLAELELSGAYDPVEHDEQFTHFGWRQFSDEEWELCPPVVAVGGDGAMYDIGFQNLSRLMMSGKPVKVLVLDTQVYSNTGGQACTSGFFGQVSDMAQFGKAIQGKEEPRKEIGLIGMAHRTTYVLQSGIAHPAHMIEGFIRGLKARRPALFNLYASCQPEHGIGDDMSHAQAKLAVESRAYPLFRYDPDLGATPQECFDLEGNPSVDADWPTSSLEYVEDGREKSMELPITFGDFALSEVRFRKHFRVAPPDTWNDNMMLLAEFLELDEDEREGRFPYLWTVDRERQLVRLLVGEAIVKSCEERRDFWLMLKALARAGEREPSRQEIEDDVRRELVDRMTAGLTRLATGRASPMPAETPAAVADAPTIAADDGYLAPWIDTEECTSCDECIVINPDVFAYDGRKKAFITDPNGPYQDLVKAAERCTAPSDPPGPASRPQCQGHRPAHPTCGEVQHMMFGLDRGKRRAVTFAHGVHPPESKTETAGLPIRQFPFAPVLVVPLQQHLGKPAVPVVSEGQEVTRGQTIARPDGFLSVAMHAPASGVVRRIGLAPSVAGRMVESVFLEPFPASTQEVLEGAPCDVDSASRDEIIDAIQEAGIVGLGGAAFPTHAKLRFPEDKHIDALIVNGVECEPYLTTDHRVMLEQQSDIFAGIRYLAKATGAPRVLIGVEANKADAADALRAGLPDDQSVKVAVLDVKYPQGAEKMLITALLAREVPSGGLPIDVGALCVNVATTAEIGRLLPHGAGIQERVITIGGPGIVRKGNYRIPIGTPLRFLLDTVGTTDDVSRVFLGGPMMGAATSSLDVPITKGTSGVVAFTERETGRVRRDVEYPCIRCGACLDACPLFLNPAELGLLAQSGEHERMAAEHHLMDCFECGCCSFACPSHIPLVQLFRVGKAAVRRARARAAT